MPLTNAGCVAIAENLLGTGTFFNAANCRIAIGSSSAPFDPTQTDLQAASEKTRKGMSPTYPQRTGATLTLRSEFTGDDANHAWNEFAVVNAASGGTMLLREVEYNGTKIAGQIWVFQIELSIVPG